MSLKRKTAGGLLWSTIDSIGLNVVRLVINIIIARLLMPADFGLIALLSIFITFSDTFVYGGFMSSLIRKRDIKAEDYSTIFIFNLSTAIILYIAIYFAAPVLGTYFKNDILTQLARVMGLVIVFHSLGIVQQVTLRRNLNFKSLAIVNISSTIFSGLVGILLAYKGFGVWSLTIQHTLKALSTSLLLWYYGQWKLQIKFCKITFKEHFSFAYKLTIGTVINTFSDYLYKVLIGIYYKTEQLGYYYQAQKLGNLPPTIISNTFKNVSYPILSSLQDNRLLLQKVYFRLLRLISFVSFPLMISLILISHPLLMLLLTDKWAQSIPFFQLFCIKGIIFSLISLNANIPLVLGRTDICVKLAIFYNIQRIIALLITIPFGVKGIIIGLVIQHFIQYFFNCWVAARLIKIPVMTQITQSLQFLLISIAIFPVAYLLKYLVPSYLYLVILQMSLFMTLYLLFQYLLKSPELKDIYSILNDRLKKYRNK